MADFWTPERVIGKLIDLLVRPFQFAPAIDVREVVGIALAFEHRSHHQLRVRGLAGAPREFFGGFREDFVFRAEDFQRHRAAVSARFDFVNRRFHAHVLRHSRMQVALVSAQLASRWSSSRSQNGGPNFHFNSIQMSANIR